MYDHVRKAHRNNPFLCKICGKEYQSRGALYNHHSIKHTQISENNIAGQPDEENQHIQNDSVK